MNSGILLVDDNPVQAATRRAILERSGKCVVTAANGEEALDVLMHAEAPASVGLIITDHLMPGMNGPALVREIRDRGWTIPVLVLSGLPDAELEYQTLNVTFRMKPLPPDSLIAIVRELLCSPMPRTA
jgi:CheY-like chemotaxis protein